jgi:integrase
VRSTLKGRAGRAATRESERANRLAKMELRFAEWQKDIEDRAKLEKSSFDEVAYALRMIELKNRINVGNYSPLERFALHQLLYEYSLQLIQHYRLSSKPTIPPVILSRSETRRTLLGRDQVQKLSSWEQAFQTRLRALSKQAPEDPADWLGLALWSAISHGTLCEADLVKSLRDRLIGDAPLFETSIGGQLSIRLTVVAEAVTNDIPPIRQKQRRVNMQTETGALRVHHYVPDGLTLALIQRWLSSDRHFPDRQKVIVTIRNALWKNESPAPNFKELANICRHSVGLIDNRPLAICSEAIGEVASGAWGSMGLDDVSHALCAGRHAPGNPRKALKLELGSDRPVQKAEPDWAIHRRLQQAVARDGNRFPSSAELSIALDAILIVCAPGSAERLLVSWFISLLNNDRKPRTVATYHSRISARVIDSFDGQSLNAFDSADFDLVYRQIIDDVRQENERDQIAGRLAQLHAFGMKDKDYRLPPLTEPIASNDGSIFVRARHIPARFIPAILAEIARMIPNDEGLMAAVQQSVVLAYRGGLRLGEVVKLRLRDIEDSPEQWIFIVQNRFGTNKTAAARRQLPFGALLTDSERTAFAAFVRYRQRSSLEHLLIVEPKSGDAVRDGALSRTVSLAMNAVLGGAGWTFHHLRHAAANNLFLVLEGELELAAEYSGWAADQQALIRQAVLGDVTARQKRYIALSTFIGHASPQQTFESYIHVIEPVLAARRGRQPVDQDLALYAAALELAPSRIAKMQCDANVAMHLRNRLKRWTAQPDRKLSASASKSSLADEVMPPPLPVSPPPEACRAALAIIERGGSVEEAALEGRVDVATVDRWLGNARTLRALPTKYKKPRLFDPERVERSNANPEVRELLLPTEPKSAPERYDCDMMFAHFRKVWGNPASKTDGQWVLRYLIEHADPGKSGVSFTKPENLKRFLDVFVGSGFAGDRWHLDLSRAGAATHADWEQVRPEGATYFAPQSSKMVSKGRGGFEPSPLKLSPGHARLYLQHPNRKLSGRATSNVKRSAPTLRYVPHMLAIMVSLLDVT